MYQGGLCIVTSRCVKDIHKITIEIGWKKLWYQAMYGYGPWPTHCREHNWELELQSTLKEIPTFWHRRTWPLSARTHFNWALRKHGYTEHFGLDDNRRPFIFHLYVLCFLNAFTVFLLLLIVHVCLHVSLFVFALLVYAQVGLQDTKHWHTDYNIPYFSNRMVELLQRKKFTDNFARFSKYCTPYRKY